MSRDIPIFLQLKRGYEREESDNYDENDEATNTTKRQIRTGFQRAVRFLVYLSFVCSSVRLLVCSSVCLLVCLSFVCLSAC